MAVGTQPPRKECAMRRSIPGRVLAALVLTAVLGLPSLGFAQTRHAAPKRATAERPAPGLLAQVWSLLTHLWAEEGSGLDPNGGKPQASTLGGGGASSTGDTGSGLDPNGDR